jgi:tRNA(Arg) A34 adenosine deaminase TadA
VNGVLTVPVGGVADSEFNMERSTADEGFIRQAIALAGEARRRGDHPFGALLVLDGEVVLRAMNSVVTDRDPTAHAETNLVAEAVRHLSRDHVARSVLYTSCEPCAMCVGKMYWAGIRTVVFGLSSQDLAVLAGRDFLVPCRELFARATDPVDIRGPLLPDEAKAVHIGFWQRRQA